MRTREALTHLGWTLLVLLVAACLPTSPSVDPDIVMPSNAMYPAWCVDSIAPPPDGMTCLEEREPVVIRFSVPNPWRGGGS